MTPLLDNQAAGFSKLKRYKVGALFMEPGSGKTRTAYELVRSVPECDYILWLTPFQTKSNLRAELDKWGAEGIRIEGIESLSSSDRLYLNLTNELTNAKRPFIIVDESLKIKNWDAIRTRRIVEIGKLAEYKLILNGTPLSRNIVDLWAQMQFLSPKILGMDTAEFKGTFCEITKLTKRVAGKEVTKEWITKYHNVDYLYSLIAPYVYECTLNLGITKHYERLSYDLDQESKEEYTALKVKYLDNEVLMAMNNNIFLEMTQKMQHIYCCTPEKDTLLKRVVDMHQKGQVLVYTKYIASREHVTKQFPGVDVKSYGMHSYGLNLQHYNVIVFWDKTWDYAQRIQTERRIEREGQQQACFFYDLDGNVGLEELIKTNIDKKQDLLTYFKQVSVEQLKKEL